MSNTAHPDDAVSFSEAESSEEELDRAMSDEDCEVCRSLRLPYPERMSTTCAKLWSAIADGCDLCKLLQRVSETAFTGASITLQDTDRIQVFPGLTRVKKFVTWLGVETVKAGTFQGPLHFRLTHYTSYTDTTGDYNVIFNAALGRA